MEHTAPANDSPQGPVKTSAGFALDLQARPNLAEGTFVDWDQQFLSRGYAPPEEANEYGTPATWMGKSTGFGKHAYEKAGSAAPAPVQATFEPAPADAPRSPQMPGQAPQPAAQPAAQPTPAPSPNGLADPRGAMPFATALLPMMGAMGHPMGVAAGFGGDAPAAPAQPQPQPQAPPAPMAKATAPGPDWIDWSGFDAFMARMVGEGPAAEESPEEEPQPAERTTTAMGRGTGATLTYETETEAEKSLDPAAAFDVLMKSMLQIARDDALEKARGHKYKSRKRVGNRWVYDYGDEGKGGKGGKGGAQLSLFGDDKPKKPAASSGSRRSTGSQAALGDLRQQEKQLEQTSKDAKATAAKAKTRLMEQIRRVGANPSTVRSFPSALGEYTTAMQGLADAGHVDLVENQKADFKGTYGFGSGAMGNANRDAYRALDRIVDKHRQVEEAKGVTSPKDATKKARALFKDAKKIAKKAAEGVAPWSELQAFKRQTQRTASVMTQVGDVEHAKAFVRATQHEMKKLKALGGQGQAVNDQSVAAMHSDMLDAARSVMEHFTKKAKAKKSMSDDTHPLPLASFDQYGRPLSKGLYSFRNSGRDAPIPDEYLYDYLCAFVEEAYEHESREAEHSQLSDKDRLRELARAVMHELVQTIPQNPNLMRAAKQWPLTVDAVAKLLVAKGIHKPRADSEWTSDADSMAAMHAPTEGEVLSLSFATSDFDMHGRPGMSLAPPPVDNVAHLMKSEAPIDPFEDIRRREAQRVADLWKSAGVVEMAPAQIAADCPVHNGRDVSKAQQLWNPMLPCKCGGEPNPYG